ncbi:hypothetical protein [Geminocystis sp. NIES-3709]|uniref:hypothetical protein n=1 Tax=Geminocystis sp. NIES-3709 TaxID=1617448 RepID=UPI0005FCCB4C|nr:hypothetical protein [Geminocystis sp. NIES-3709]BAQ67099.1 hypothetical protein GM3709_3864 [Geminocystis sp. NIES-3709]
MFKTYKLVSERTVTVNLDQVVAVKWQEDNIAILVTVDGETITIKESDRLEEHLRTINSKRGYGVML